jgi:hypothetical protein
MLGLYDGQAAYPAKKIIQKYNLLSKISPALFDFG